MTVSILIVMSMSLPSQSYAPSPGPAPRGGILSRLRDRILGPRSIPIQVPVPMVEPDQGGYTDFASPPVPVPVIIHARKKPKEKPTVKKLKKKPVLTVVKPPVKKKVHNSLKPIAVSEPEKEMPIAVSKPMSPKPVAMPKPKKVKPLAVSKPVKKRIVHRKSHFGHAPDYTWVSGRLRRIHVRGGMWVIRYAPIDRVDPYGGSVVLSIPQSMKSFRDGDFVVVRGAVIKRERASRYVGGALFEGESIRLLERPTESEIWAK